MMMFPPAAMLKMASNSAGSAEPQGVVAQAVMSAMATAVNGGLYSCTASLSGKTQADAQQVIRMLQLLGYTTSISGTTLTVKWG